MLKALWSIFQLLQMQALMPTCYVYTTKHAEIQCLSSLRKSTPQNGTLTFLGQTPCLHYMYFENILIHRRCKYCIQKVHCCRTRKTPNAKHTADIVTATSLLLDWLERTVIFHLNPDSQRSLGSHGEFCLETLPWVFYRQSCMGEAAQTLICLYLTWSKALGSLPLFSHKASISTNWSNTQHQNESLSLINCCLVASPGQSLRNYQSNLKAISPNKKSSELQKLKGGKKTPQSSRVILMFACLNSNSTTTTVVHKPKICSQKM